MGTISIAIPTYRRPEELRRLLDAVLPQAAAAATPVDPVEIVIADNDAERSAEQVVSAWVGERRDSTVPVRYVHEPQPGIAAVRNRLLDETAESHLLIFIDDDQYPADDWLATLLSAWARGDADLVAGLVTPVYPDGVAEWIRQGPFHDGPDFASGHVMDHAATGNLLLDRQLVARSGCRFPAYGTRGAEDSYFTKALTEAGAVIRWCPESVAYEPVPHSRTRPRWVVKRSFGNGLSWGALLAEQGTGPSTRGRRLAVTGQGAVRVVAGLSDVAAAAVTRSPAQLGRGYHRAARGLGMVGGAWGLVYDEYARPGTQRWRIERAVR